MTRSRLYRFLRIAKRTPERLLHGVRRGRALRRLAARSTTSSVLVMCYGNICRSPFAAARLASLLAPLGTKVVSAGLFGSDRCTPEEGRAAAQHRGVNLVPHRSRLVTSDVVRETDVVVVMDALQARAIVSGFAGDRRQVFFLGDFDPEAIDTRHIRDPEGQSLTVFSDVYDRIDRCTAAMAAALGAVPRRV